MKRVPREKKTGAKGRARPLCLLDYEGLSSDCLCEIERLRREGKVFVCGRPEGEAEILSRCRRKMPDFREAEIQRAYYPVIFVRRGKKLRALNAPAGRLRRWRREVMPGEIDRVALDEGRLFPSAENGEPGSSFFKQEERVECLCFLPVWQAAVSRPQGGLWVLESLSGRVLPAGGPDEELLSAPSWLIFALCLLLGWGLCAALLFWLL